MLVSKLTVALSAATSTRASDSSNSQIIWRSDASKLLSKYWNRDQGGIVSEPVRD
jgi:hypothetical protein